MYYHTPHTTLYYIIHLNIHRHVPRERNILTFSHHKVYISHRHAARETLVIMVAEAEAMYKEIDFLKEINTTNGEVMATLESCEDRIESMLLTGCSLLQPAFVSS